jgi:hypothetical protein
MRFLSFPGLEHHEAIDECCCCCCCCMLLLSFLLLHVVVVVCDEMLQNGTMYREVCFNSVYYHACGEYTGALGSSVEDSCSSMGTITQMPCIGRDTVRNTFSLGNLYFSIIVRTSPSVPHFISCTLPMRYVDLVSFR